VVLTAPNLLDISLVISPTLGMYRRYVKATGAVYHNKTRLLQIPSAHYSNLQSLSFIIDCNIYKLNPNAQILPRTYNTHLGGDADHLYLAVSDLWLMDSHIGFITGVVLLEWYHMVYGNDYPCVGFTRTQLTNATDINWLRWLEVGCRQVCRNVSDWRMSRYFSITCVTTSVSW